MQRREEEDAAEMEQEESSTKQDPVRSESSGPAVRGVRGWIIY